MSARLRNLNPYELHKHLVNIYCLNTKGSTNILKRDTSRDRTDLDVIRENHKFLWNEDDETDTWEKQLAKKYYDKLFKEYCICDLSRYKDNKTIKHHGATQRNGAVTGEARAEGCLRLALRWRVENEVVMGKGQFQCGNKHCINDHELKSWEVNFAYKEENVTKNALVKLRLCPDCSMKLNYKSKKREIKRLKRNKKTLKKSKRSDSKDDDEPGTPPELDINIPTTSDVTQNEPTEMEDSSLWQKGPSEVEEKSREEEFENYLEDLLL